jgi:hypothetical protein
MFGDIFSSRGGLGQMNAMTAREREEVERHKNQQYRDMMNAAAMSQATLVQGLSSIQGSGYQEVQSSFKPEFGVLYNGKEQLPHDWAGAKITSVKREARAKGWLITFISKWDSGLRIQLWLDIEQVNGTEAHTIATTYMEALNQRRVG